MKKFKGYKIRHSALKRARIAVNKGYKLDNDGNVLGPNGKLKPFSTASGWSAITVRLSKDERITVYLHVLRVIQSGVFDGDVYVTVKDGDKSNVSRDNVQFEISTLRQDLRARKNRGDTYAQIQRDTGVVRSLACRLVHNAV